MTSISSTALLFSISILHVLGSESRSLEVQSGQSAILFCSNYTSSPSSIFWFRAVRRSTLGRILGIFSPSEPVSSEDQRFTATSNLSHIFLTIKSVNTLDTGLYFCGYDSTLGLIIKGSTYLDVKEADTGVIARDVLVPVLGGLVLFLILAVIGLALKNKKLQAHIRGLAGQTEDENSENLNYAAVHFRHKPGPSPMTSQNETETATYAAVKRTRQEPETL